MPQVYRKALKKASLRNVPLRHNDGTANPGKPVFQSLQMERRRKKLRNAVAASAILSRAFSGGFLRFAAPEFSPF